MAPIRSVEFISLHATGRTRANGFQYHKNVIAAAKIFTYCEVEIHVQRWDINGQVDGTARTCRRVNVCSRLVVKKSLFAGEQKISYLFSFIVECGERHQMW
jgi:hypothetical protein